MKLISSSQRGAAAVLGLLVLSIILFFGMAGLYLARSSYQDEQTALRNMQLRLSAESGVERMAVQLSSDGALRERVMASGKDVFLASYPAFGQHSGCKVYAKKRNEGLAILAVSSRDAKRCRSLGVMEKQGEKWILVHWEE